MSIDMYVACNLLIGLYCVLVSQTIEVFLFHPDYLKAKFKREYEFKIDLLNIMKKGLTYIF